MSKGKLRLVASQPAEPAAEKPAAEETATTAETAATTETTAMTEPSDPPEITPDQPEPVGLTKEQLELFHLAADLVPLEANRLRPRVGRLVSLEDLIGWGNYGRLKAAQRYDPTRNTDWKTYAKTCIGCAMLDAARQEMRGSVRLSLTARRAGRGPLKRFVAQPQSSVTTDSVQHWRAEMDDFMGVMLASMLVATASAMHHRPADAQIEACETQQGVLAVIASFSERDRSLIEQHVVQKIPLTEIAKERGIKPWTMVRTFDRVMKLFHARLHGRQIDHSPPYLQGPAPNPAPRPATKKRHG